MSEKLATYLQAFGLGMAVATSFIFLNGAVYDLSVALLGMVIFSLGCVIEYRTESTEEREVSANA